MTKQPKLTKKQQEILLLLYRFRFLNRIQIQTLLVHKDHKTINIWLRDLREKGCVEWIYSEGFAERTKPAVYYLGLNGLVYLRDLLKVDQEGGIQAAFSPEALRKHYKESIRSQTYIDRCILLADFCISLKQQSTDTINFDTAQADLNATKVAQGTVTAGQPITYRFTVTNNGPDNAGAVSISDVLPSYLSYQSFTSVSGGTWNCNASSQTVTCGLGSILNNGSTAVVDVTVLVDQDAPNTAVNTASVTFNGNDTSANNPSASNPVTHLADLEVQITHEQKTYRSGDTVNYTYTVINHGPSTAKDVVLSDTISNGFTVTGVSGTAPGGDSILARLDHMLFPTAGASSSPFACHLNGQQLSCTTATLAVGTYKIYVTGTINNSFTGTLTNTASITSATPDPNPNDTTATDVITGILLGNGLPNTGQNIFLWIGLAVVVIASGVTTLIVSRRRRTL